MNSHLFNFEDLEAQAEKYLEAVREKAREIVAKAAQNAERIQEEARQKGFQEGLKQGKNQALELVQDEVQARVQTEVEIISDQVLTQMRSIAGQCAELREELTRNWENAFLSLVTRVSRVILRRELEKDPQIEIQWIREMLQLCAGENSLILTLNPQDAERLQAPLERLAGEFGKIGQMTIKTSPAMARGDCVLKTENGQLDQRLDVQLERIAEELRS